jgi:hypothetical protein
MECTFTWIARINSALFLLLLLGIGFVAGSEIWHDLDRDKSHPVVVVDDTNTTEPTPLTLGRVERIDGSEFMMIRLEARQDGKGLTSGSSYRKDTHNALFLAGGGAQATWLFDNNKNLIDTLFPLQQDVDGNRTGPAVALYIEYATADTNGDGAIDDSDKLTVALAKLDGSSRTELLHNVDRTFSSELIDERTLAVVYQIGKTIHHARYRADTFEPLSDQTIIEIPANL